MFVIRNKFIVYRCVFKVSARIQYGTAIYYEALADILETASNTSLQRSFKFSDLVSVCARVFGGCYLRNKLEMSIIYCKSLLGLISFNSPSAVNFLKNKSL